MILIKLKFAHQIIKERGQGFGILVSKFPKETSASYSLREPSEASTIRRPQIIYAKFVHAFVLFFRNIILILHIIVSYYNLKYFLVGVQVMYFLQRLAEWKKKPPLPGQC